MSTPLVSPTVEDMLQNIRNMLGQPDPTNSFWTDSELLAYINEAVRIHFAELTNIDEGHFVTTTSLDITANQRTVDLPSDFFKMKALYKTVTNGNILLNYRNNLSSSFFNDGGSGDTYLPDYYFQGNKLVLMDTPTGSQTGALFLEYMQFPETLLSGADQLTAQIAPIFRQVVERYSTYLAKLKETMVSGAAIPQSLSQNLADVLTQFRDVVAIRSKTPTHIIPFSPE